MQMFMVKQTNSDGDFVSDAMMGPNSLAMEIEYLPVGWKLEVTRVEDWTGEKKEEGAKP